MMKLLCSIVLGLALTTGVYAQQQQAPTGSQTNPAFSEIKISQGDMIKFKAIEPKITDLQKELYKKIGEVKTPEAARKLQATYQEKMVKVVIDKGLTVDKYNAIKQGQAPTK